MVPIFQWISWTNIFKYAGEILAANEFHNLPLTCKTNGKCKKAQAQHVIKSLAEVFDVKRTCGLNALELIEHVYLVNDVLHIEPRSFIYAFNETLLEYRFN